ncbi:hypothetical protein EDB92DRAFT_1909157 [Lactarius akahatsu]|uniref:Uncharacterized protein n=1 Tax=Lactarius akahatsu TaxID=416441 RepID=A0AAD4L3S8_9AGAM|nr:hypothetical protein EDB92DRAFT_1909157 [Lactarius akahatsu]
MQSTVHQARDEAGGINQIKKDVDERLQSFEDRLDNIRLTVGQHNDMIKGDVLTGFSSLQTRLDNFKSSIETSRRGWQANFGASARGLDILQVLQIFTEESVHKKLHSVEAVLADILKALPVPEDNTIKQTPITALDPQPLACSQRPEGQINSEGPESIIVDRKDEATNLTVPPVAEEQLLTPPGEPRNNKEICGVVQPQTTNNYSHGVEGLGADVSAEHLLKGFEMRQVAMIVAFAIILYYTYDICSHVIQVRDVV